MKFKLKAALAVILALVMALTVVPAFAVERAENIFSQNTEDWNASTEAATDSCHPNIKNYSDTTLQGMRSRAEAIINHEWIPSNDIRTWNNNPYNGSMYFYAGSVVRGVPYTLFTTEVVSWSLLSLAQYTQVESFNYHDTAYCVSVGARRTGPVYGSCCADLVCEVFGGSYMSGDSTGYHNVPAVRNAPKSNTLYRQTIDNISPGDALSDDPGHTHIVWVGDVTDTHITIYEQTPPVARKVVLNKANNTNSEEYLVYGGKVYNVITRSTEFVDSPVTPPSFAAVSTDKSSYAINEAVTFNIDSDGNINTLWIYLPDGSSTYYENVGSTYQLAFGWAGRYEALVQTWNSLGSYTSESVSFSVGAPTYAAVSTDKDSYAIDEAVYFAINADGNTNTLWIYLPDGTSTYYENIGSSYQLAFGWTGRYEALVQTWNDQGSFISERISFTIGAPTFAAVSTDKDSYAIDEAVYFTINADGNTNTLWVYLPDGSSTYYENVGSSYQLAFGLSGRYEALVQTWNDHGSCISEIVSFSVGILIGDVDSNGNITIADALLALRMAMSILPVSNLEAADVDGNGNISIMDALVIMRMSIGTT